MLRGSLLGDSQALVDISSYWTNMTYFEIPLPCGTSYVATVESRNAAGISGPSASLNSTTGKWLSSTISLQTLHPPKKTCFKQYNLINII